MELKACVKGAGLTPAVPSEREAWSAGEACGMRGVAVKCIDITRNPDCEGGVPYRH